MGGNFQEGIFLGGWIFRGEKSRFSGSILEIF